MWQLNLSVWVNFAVNPLVKLIVEIQKVRLFIWNAFALVKKITQLKNTQNTKTKKEIEFLHNYAFSNTRIHLKVICSL